MEPYFVSCPRNTFTKYKLSKIFHKSQKLVIDSFGVKFDAIQIKIWKLLICFAKYVHMIMDMDMDEYFHLDTII